MSPTDSSCWRLLVAIKEHWFTSQCITVSVDMLSRYRSTTTNQHSNVVLCSGVRLLWVWVNRRFFRPLSAAWLLMFPKCSCISFLWWCVVINFSKMDSFYLCLHHVLPLHLVISRIFQNAFWQPPERGFNVLCSAVGCSGFCNLMTERQKQGCKCHSFDWS